MKIVWISDSLFSVDPINSTGGWRLPLAVGLAKSGKVQLYNIVHGKQNNGTIINEFEGIVQYVIPKYRRGDHRFNKYEPNWSCKLIASILDEIKPDVVHFWGTESRLCSIHTKGYVKYPCVIDIQGLFSSYYYYYYGDMTPMEVFRSSANLYALLHRHGSPYEGMKSYKKHGKWEQDVLKSFKNISVQSHWVEEQIKSFHSDATFHHTGIALRKEFCESTAWLPHPEHSSPVIYSSAANFEQPYKGLYVLLKALIVLRQTYPNIELRLAGHMNLKKSGIQQGYRALLTRFIRQNKLERNIQFLGPLQAADIVRELHDADICVVPSFVETYCLAAAESMTVGCPTICSYAGAMPELARDGEGAIFYNSIDYKGLSDRIICLFLDKEKCSKMGAMSRAKHLMDHDISVLVDKQVRIYKDIIG